GHVAVEFDVVQAEFAGFDFQRIFLVQVAQFLDVLMTIECVVVKIHLRVERVNFVISCNKERIDFGERSVGIFESSIEGNHELDRIVDQLRSKAEAKCKAARLEGLQAKTGLNVLPENKLRIPGGDFFDVHAPGCRRHKDRLTGLTIDN